MLTWRVLACPKPGGARGSAFDSKSKGWWFDSTPGFRSGSSVGTIPSSSSSFCCLIFLFRLRAHVFPESICLGAANYRGSFFFKRPQGSLVSTKKYKPQRQAVKGVASSLERIIRSLFLQAAGGWESTIFLLLPQSACALANFFPYHKANPNPNPSPLTLTVTLALNLPQRACALGNFPYHKAKLEPSSSYITLTLT